MDNSGTTTPAPRVPDRGPGMRRRSTRTSIAGFVALTSLLGASAVWANPASAAPTTAAIWWGCEYPLPLYTAEGTYVRFYTYKKVDGEWQRSKSNWYYVRGFRQYEYTSAGWEFRGGTHTYLLGAPAGKVYVKMWTYTASSGWVGTRLARCIDGVSYPGW